MSLDKAAISSRQDKAKRLLAKYVETKPTNWDAIDTLVIKVCNRRLPTEYKTGPVSYTKLNVFLSGWAVGNYETQEVNTEATSASIVTAPTAISLVAGIQLPVHSSGVPPNVFGEVTLFPEQYETFSNLYLAYKSGQIVGATNNGNTGSGKTYVMLALIHAFAIHDKLHERDFLSKLRTIPYMLITRKNIIAQTREVARSMGLGPLLDSGKLMIAGYSLFSSTAGSRFLKKEYDAFTNTFIYEWFPQACPLIALFDEAQSLCNPDTIQTQAFNAMLQVGRKIPCWTLLLSATLADNVAKMGSAIASYRKPIKIENVEYVVRDTKHWCDELAYKVCEEPTKSNSAAMKRLRDIIDPYMFEIKNVRWPARARNRTLLFSFENDHDKEIYNKAFRVYQEKLAKLNRSVSDNPLAEWIAINVFRKTVEPMRNPGIATRIKQNLSNGIATAVGHVFKQSVTDLVFRLGELGIGRDQISIIWGGGKDFDEENTYTEAALGEYVEKLRKGEILSRSVLNKLKRTLAFREELAMSGDDSTTRYARYDKLRELGMTGAQSADQRWSEIKRFQNGITKVCIFTLASGGVGLSLDRNKPELWPRELIAGLCLSGPEFKQVLGRLVRRGTMPGYVDQYIALMKDTVEQITLKPLIERKLGNMAELGTKGIDPTEITMDDSGQMNHEEITIEQLNKIADSDESQVKSDDDEDEEEPTV